MNHLYTYLRDDREMVSAQHFINEAPAENKVNMFLKEDLCSPRLHLFGQKYIKNLVKSYYNLK